LKVLSTCVVTFLIREMCIRLPRESVIVVVVVVVVVLLVVVIVWAGACASVRAISRVSVCCVGVTAVIVIDIAVLETLKSIR
jgi:hypothetical protein